MSNLHKLIKENDAKRRKEKLQKQSFIPEIFRDFKYHNSTDNLKYFFNRLDKVK